MSGWHLWHVLPRRCCLWCTTWTWIPKHELSVCCDFYQFLIDCWYRATCSCLWTNPQFIKDFCSPSSAIDHSYVCICNDEDRNWRALDFLLLQDCVTDRSSQSHLIIAFDHCARSFSEGCYISVNQFLWPLRSSCRDLWMRLLKLPKHKILSCVREVTDFW